MKSVCMLLQNIYDLDSRVRRKAEALVAAGYIVDVLALAPADKRKKYVLNGVNVHTVPLGKKRGSLLRYIYEYFVFLVWALSHTIWLMKQRQYSVVEVNTLPDFLVFAAVPARWMGAKIILDMHEITPEFYISKYGIPNNSILVRVLRYLERISFNCADRVITINEPIQDLLIKRGLAPSKSIVVMNSVDDRRFASVSPGSVQKGNSERFVMMYHGTLTQFYGLGLGITAFGMAHSEMPEAELWILGSGPEKGALANLVRECGLTSKVKLVGQVPSEQIANWLDKCTVGLLPLRRDVFLDFAFPNKLPEFIVTGKPVLMSRLRAIRHYFSEEALAYFEPNNPADLARQMIRLYKDPQLCARLAVRAMEEYAPIRWDVMKQRYLKLVEEMDGLERATFEKIQQRLLTVEPTSRS